MPQATSEIAHALVRRGRLANPAIVAALDDREKFAAAHVLLTMNSGPFCISDPTWNGLQVTLYGDGSVDLHPDQLPEIRSLWQRKLSGEDEPDPLSRDFLQRLRDRDAEITAAFGEIQVGMSREEVGSLMPTPHRTTKRSLAWVLSSASNTSTEYNIWCTVYFANGLVKSKQMTHTCYEVFEGQGE